MASELPGENPKEPSVSQEGLPAEPTRAIFVDDDAYNRDTYAEVLPHLFDQVEIVATPEEVLERFRQEGEKPNILLTDGEMPGMNGLELAKNVKELDPTVSAVLVSGGIGNLNLSDKAMLQANGVDFYLAKPFKVAEMREVIGQIKAARAQRPPIAPK